MLHVCAFGLNNIIIRSTKCMHNMSTVLSWTSLKCAILSLQSLARWPWCMCLLLFHYISLAIHEAPNMSCLGSNNKIYFCGVSGCFGVPWSLYIYTGVSSLISSLYGLTNGSVLCNKSPNVQLLEWRSSWPQFLFCTYTQLRLVVIYLSIVY